MRKDRPLDARHLRELLMTERLPESWIPPAHLLDLRARVRLRHALVNQRGEWAQRLQAVLYHHGCPARRYLTTSDGRVWLERQPLPDTAREQVTVALAMTDALDAQMGPIDKQLGAFARRQAGTRALMAHYGIGPLTSVVILAELGDARRFSSSREAVRYAGLDITVHQFRQAPQPRTSLPPRAPGAAVGALRSRPVRATQDQPRPRLLPTDRRPDRRQPRLPGSRTETPQTQLPHPPRTRRRRPRSRLTIRCAPRPDITDAPRPAPRILLPPRPRGRPQKTERPQRTYTSGNTPITIMCPTRRTAGRGPR